MILLCRKDIYRQIRKSIDNSRLEYFKRELKAVLKKQLDGESNEVEKSFSQRIDEILKGYDRAHLVPKQVRAVNEKTGKSYMKTVYINPNKQYGLKKYHETDSKGSKIAIAKLMKAVDKCQSEEELYKLVLRNKGRFSDSEGKPLPIAAELRKYIDEKQKNIGKTQSKKILANTNGYDISKIKTATPTAANSVLSSSQTDEGGRNSAGKGNGSNARSKAGDGLSILPQSFRDNIPQQDNSVKENNNISEKRAAELKNQIESAFDKNMNDPYTRHTAESSIKKYGKKKLEELAKMDLETDEEYKKNLFDKVASVEKEENREISESAIDIAIWKQCVSVFMQKAAREKLKSMAENENMIDLPVGASDMDEAIGIIGSDVTRILDGRDAFGNTKQGLVDKIKRRVRNSPGVARAMLVYIKQEQEKTGKKVFTEKHSIWELLPKLNEQAAQAYEKGESETKKGVSGNLYEGEDGTTVVENKDWGRYQISFPGKPDYETISTLKRNGFRWSPKTQSWVCYNTANGERSLKQVAEKLGLKKTEIKKSSLESYVEKSIRILKMAGAV